MNYSHGHSRPQSSTYRSWAAMLRRCTNSAASNYKSYGGRGIVVALQWKSFEAFLADMGARPDGTTLGRIDSKLGYNKDNCEWQTPRQQATASSKLTTENATVICEMFKAKPATISIRAWAEEIAPSFNISAATVKRPL